MKADKRYKEAKNLLYARLPLINRPRCYTFNPDGGCLYCRNKTFRYYCTAAGKKYYQCEKCRGINH